MTILVRTWTLAIRPVFLVKLDLEDSGLVEFRDFRARCSQSILLGFFKLVDFRSHVESD